MQSSEVQGGGIVRRRRSRRHPSRHVSSSVWRVRHLTPSTSTVRARSEYRTSWWETKYILLFLTLDEPTPAYFKNHAPTYSLAERIAIILKRKYHPKAFISVWIS